MELTTNARGWHVRRTAPKPTTEAAERFAALCREQDAPEGFDKPCLIFTGDVFRVSEGETVRPRRFAMRLRGVEPPKGAKFTVCCKTPGCVRHIKVKE